MASGKRVLARVNALNYEVLEDDVHVVFLKFNDMIIDE